MSEETSSELIIDTVELLADGNKNAKVIICDFCSSKILNSGTASFTSKEHVLPYMKVKNTESGEERQGETLNQYWCVESIFGFENVGFSNTVGCVKYLVCADCDAGPIGWHDTQTQMSYVALKRVKHS